MNATSVTPPMSDGGRPLANVVTAPVFGSTRRIRPLVGSVTKSAPPGPTALPMMLPNALGRPVTKSSAVEANSAPLHAAPPIGATPTDRSGLAQAVVAAMTKGTTGLRSRVVAGCMQASREVDLSDRVAGNTRRYRGARDCRAKPLTTSFTTRQSTPGVVPLDLVREPVYRREQRLHPPADIGGGLVAARVFPGSHADGIVTRLPNPQAVTPLLLAWSGGDQAAFNALVPLVYAELRRQARRALRRESDGHTLQSIELVHEAYLR